MSRELAQTLERASKFLRALPADLPEPQVRWFATSLMLDFVKTRTHFVSVSLRATGHVYFLGENGTVAEHGWYAFDGAAVPPEILKAIRRVAL
jgi:hypothetical protein